MGDGHKIRVGQLGYSGDRPARSLDDVQVGVGCWWVEIDGQRLTDVVSVEYCAADDEITVPVVKVEVIGPIEIVYVDNQGEPLPGSGPSSEVVEGERLEAAALRPVDAA